MKKNEKAREVLVVDDSPETVELIKRNLESVGYQVYTASDVQSAIKLLEAIHIDLLITDLKMPGESGLSLVRHVSENYKGMAILVITGFPSIQTAVESIKIGAEEYLVKSFTDEELFRAVEKALSKIQHKKSEGRICFFCTRAWHHRGVRRDDEGVQYYQQSKVCQGHSIDQWRKWYGKRIGCQGTSLWS